MKLQDYIIDHQGFDWSTLLESWSWLLPPAFAVWIMNRFGDLFIVTDDGSIHLLDVGGGTFTRVAESRDHFVERMDEADNASNWLLIPLIEQLVSSGRVLPEGQCYSFVMPPVLSSGEYKVGNTCMVAIAEHYGRYGEFHRTIKDLPDGTRVSLEVRD